MVKKTYGLILLVIMLIISCKENNNGEKESTTLNQLHKASWLIGEWGNRSEERIITEIWKKESDSAYVGRSYVVHNMDTVSSETIRLEAHEDKLFYIPTVKDQNIGEVVMFTLEASEGSQLIFKNAAHDFPQKISYKFITKDSLLAEISGMHNGQEQTEQFPMHRIK